ncbi:MAG: peptidylprolyl isomerase [Gemmatimonadales bacterium]
MRTRIKTRWRAALLIAVVTTTGCDALSSPSVLARAGGHVLTAEQMARILADWRSIPLRPDMAERWAHRWVEYALLAERLASGDSLLDSATVAAVAWPDISAYVTGLYDDSLIKARVVVDSATIDSVFEAGELRVIDHILAATSVTTPPAEREAARRKAERIRARLAAGGSWEAANRESDDVAGRQRGGRLGVIGRGQTAPEFERAAFALAPGELSQVVETRFGYHVIRRATLEESRDLLEQAVREMLIARFDSARARELDEQWSITVRPKGPELLREAALRPLAHIASHEVVGTYRGGEFTVADMIRWLRASPPQLQFDILESDDERIVEGVRSLIRRDVRFREALDAGFALPPELLAELRFRLRRNIRRVTENLDLDDVLRDTLNARDRRAAIDSVLLRFFADVGQRKRVPVFVPTFLSDELRGSMGWSVNAKAFDRVVARAAEMRAAADTTAGETTAAGTVPGASDGH